MEREVTCYCEHKFSADFPEEVDLQEQPQAEQQILTGAFMSVRCPACGKLLKPEFRVRVRDDSRDMDIYLFPELERGAWMRGDLQGEVPPGVRRVVIGFPELIEKLRIAASHLDDRVVEVLKFHVMRKAREDAAERNVRIYFAEYSAGAMVLHVHSLRENEVGIVRVPESTVRKAAKELPRTLRNPAYRSFLSPLYVSCLTVYQDHDEEREGV